MFVYKKRTVSQMRHGKIDCIQDFEELDRKFSEGEIPYEEWSAEFSKRRHTIPFSIGGSAVGTLLGNSKWKTPRELQLEISFPNDPNYKEKHSDETLYNFARGHFFEDGVARMGGFMLKKFLTETEDAEIRADDVVVLPFTQQLRNMAFPNCIGDFDRAVRIYGGKYDGWWLGEVKTTKDLGPDRGYWGEYFSRTDLSAEERIPPAYLNQTDYYLGILPYMRGAIFFASCGYDAEENVQIMYERNDERSCTVLNVAQEFCEKSRLGIDVTDDEVTDPRLLKKALKITHGAMDKSLPPADLSDNPYMSRYVETDREIKALKKQIEEETLALQEQKDELDQMYEEENKDVLEKIRFLENERKLIEYKMVPSLGDACTGVAEIDGTQYKLRISKTPSFEKKTKAFFRKKYPEQWKAVSEYDPIYSVSMEKVSSDENRELKMIDFSSEKVAGDERLPTVDNISGA